MICISLINTSSEIPIQKNISECVESDNWLFYIFTIYASFELCFESFLAEIEFEYFHEFHKIV